ncbi:GNAT family N-acetyltransferase [Clostridium thermarum]|uniref:GNAT family N-acetyltransferase n=1 Tax=Clostridium thermarum TaxID=1716543 RepID=UPI0013D2236E|nr:GNAT family N-acetyltransferase [Clostridium thermarum]
MFDVELAFEDVEISSILKEDFAMVQNWMGEQIRKTTEAVWTNIEELGDRFLEYYMSENEIFLKIKKEDKLIGVFKGRVEFKNPNEVIIWCFVIDCNLRGQGLGSKILKELIKYFEINYDIYSFSTGIVAGSNSAVQFWKKNNFLLHRVSKSFFNVEGEEKDMLLYKFNENIRVV